MADKRISDFPLLSDSQDDDLLLVSANSETYKMTVKLLKDAIKKEVAENSKGITSAQIIALDNMFKAAAYTLDVSVAYSAFRQAFDLDGSGGDEPSVKSYTITNTLTNATTNNSARLITEGGKYTATITADSGYKIESVTVTMGGVDITATAYSAGKITIENVSGNIVITVTTVVSASGEALVESGLLAYFDLRNAPASKGNDNTGWYMDCTTGSGRLYGWANRKVAGDEYGINPNPDYCAGTTYTAHDFGNAFTWVIKSYGQAAQTPRGFKKYVSPTNSNASIKPSYNNTSSTVTELAETASIERTKGYSTVTVVVSNSNFKIYFNDKKKAEVDGAAISDFSSWYSKATIGESWSVGDKLTVVAVAFYNRALKESEIVENVEFLKTLEVAE